MKHLTTRAEHFSRTYLFLYSKLVLFTWLKLSNESCGLRMASALFVLLPVLGLSTWHSCRVGYEWQEYIHISPCEPLTSRVQQRPTPLNFQDEKKTLRYILLGERYIIIILSCHQHGYPWPSLATPPYRSSLLAGPQGYVPYPHIAAGCPDFARPCEGVHWRTSLMSTSLLLQKCPARLVRITLIVFVMGGLWPYSCCFVECCLQDLFEIGFSILV